MSNNKQQTPLFVNPISEPLPELIAESIRQATLMGKLSPGEQLPGEPEFAAQLGVSRVTLRDAVRILVGEGILERRRGVGTFVARNPLINIQEGLETLLSTTELIKRTGYAPGTLDSHRQTIPASSALADVLEISAGQPLLHFSRTRTANDVPVIHCKEYLPAAVLGLKEDPDWDLDWSLYELLHKAGLGVVSAVCKITPVQADSWLAGTLHVSEGHPLLLLRQTHFSSDHRPILYCENYHNSSVIEFHVIRKR